jgi:hypothetical protein
MQVQCWITWWIGTSREEPARHRYTAVTAPEFSSTEAITARPRTPCFQQGLKRFYAKCDTALVTSRYQSYNKSYIKTSGPNSLPKCYTEQRFNYTGLWRCYPFKACWLSEAPTSLTFNNCTLCPHCIYAFCIYFGTNSDLCHIINWLVSITEMKSVYCKVRTGSI